LSLFRWQRVLPDHPQDGELRIRRHTGDGAGLLETKWRSFILLAICGCENQKVRTCLAGLRTNGNGPESAASGIDKGIKIVIVLQHERMPVRRKIRWHGVPPDLRLNLVESLRERGVEFLILA